MEKFKIFKQQLYDNCTELIISVLKERDKFKKIHESSDRVIFEDSNTRLAHLTSTELILRYKHVSLYYRENIIQFCTNGIFYINDVVYIPTFHDYSFYSLGTEDELFQLSTIIDIKNITLRDIQRLNYLREYFDFRHLVNNV